MQLIRDLGILETPAANSFLLESLSMGTSSTGMKTWDVGLE